MYTTTQRFTDSSYQRTFSWRTGRLTSGESPRVAVPNSPTRQPGENLGTFLGRRNKYYSTMASNLQQQASYQGHVLVTDGGHSFHTAKIDLRPGRYFHTKGSIVVREGTCTPYLRLLERDRLFLNQELEGKPSFATATGRRPVLTHPDQSRHQSTLDLLVKESINNTVPDAGQFGWGETIVELLRGNYPKLLPDFVKRITRGRKLDPKATARSLGSDYLNARFGIEPIMRDILGTVSHLMNVHENLYDNYKRSRMTRQVSSFYTENNASVMFQKGSTADVRNMPTYTSTLVSDSSLRCKYTKVRPSSRAQAFYDEAYEILNRYGVNQKLTWDLIPYSWLVDWYGNIGSSIETAAAFNPTNGRFLTTYSWSTRQTTFLSIGTSVSRKFWSGYPDVERADAGWCNVVVKERSSIPPFGPNFALPSLSPYQWSILVSLGLAKIK